MNRSKNYTPGFIMVLHTFGRDLKWNPHIHCLISEGSFSDDGFWKNVSHFNYSYLRNAFRTALLNELEKRIGPSFKKTKALCYRNNKHGFYVYVQETLPVLDFIRRLIRHIPEKYFKMIRYGGLYARRRESDKKLNRAISREKHRFLRSFLEWRTAIFRSFGYDPLKCPKCGTTMFFLELYFNHQRVSLEELYEQARRKDRQRRSSA